MEYKHIPVMLTEVMDYLLVKPGGLYMDCTLGGASYTVAISKQLKGTGKVVSLDLDENALTNAKKIIKKLELDNIVLVRSNFKNIEDVARDNFPKKSGLDGIVFDLGLSSFQLDDQKRGFSFLANDSLDMAFGPGVENSTITIINNYPLLELTRIFREYGEEKRAYYLAKVIVEGRRLKKIETSSELANLIESKTPARFRGKIHPATRIFQALRMETNDELENLRFVLPAAVNLLKPGGRLVLVSFHSGEDRIVKHFFKDNSSLQILTKKPIKVSPQEAAENPRSRSAKLRAATKI